VDFQDKKTAPPKASKGKVERNPNNYNILKGGQVDPGSKLYQRSVAGREQLKDYLSRLSNSGADEADVFMAGVKSLMKRGHGYVGAYLDSKNPGRVYEKNQAMAITDQVMTDEGIGENPGARLTRPKVEDEEGNIDKEATKEARAKRREANKGRGFGPQQAPGKKAMPVGQQRKQGKRTGSERVDEGDKRREGIDDPTKYEQPVKANTGDTEFYNRDQIKKALEDRMSGKATTDDVLAAYQTTYQKPLSDSPQADAERRQKRAESRDRFYTTGSGKMPEGEKKPAGGGAQPPSGGAQPPTGGTPSGDNRSPSAQPSTAPDEQETDSKVDEEGRETATPKMYLDAFKDAMMGNIQNNVPVNSKKSQEGLIEEILDVLSDNYDVDENQARKQILRTYGRMGIGGYKLLIDPAKKEISPQDKPPGVPEPQEQAQTAPAPAPQEQSASPPQVKYKKPNIEREWNEAARYPEFETAGIEGWSDAVKNGKPTKFSQLGDVNNVDLNYDSLDEGKKNNFQQAFKDGVIETPIVGRFEDGSYELIAGNTRLSGLVKNGVDPTVMVVDFPSGEGEEAAPAAASKKPGRGLNVPAQPARKSGGGVPFTPEVGKQATDTIRQAVSEGKGPEEVVELFKQGNLFPGGLATDTPETNPLEGGSTLASPGPSGTAPTQEEKGGSLLDEQGQAKDFRKSGPQPTGGGTARQLPLPLGRENTAAKLKGRADVEKRRLAKQEKSLGKPSPRPRKTGKSPTQPDLFTKSGNPRKFNTSEMSSMSYDEFSQSVRSLLR
jgi:hypothetical protein